MLGIDEMKDDHHHEFHAIDPNKKQDEFRNYENGARTGQVAEFYIAQHREQTYEFVQSMHKKHLGFSKGKMTVWDAIKYLDNVIDESDPDTDLSQMMHALQSAEACRRMYPDNEWLQVACLIHDLGKIMAVTDPVRGLVGDPQWAVVGDTFPVGCRFHESNVFHAEFQNNSDWNHPVYSSDYGLYKPRCGFENVTFSWGHDEYLYQVLKNHPQCQLPDEALYVIRFHSFYPWHSNGGYSYLASDLDHDNLKYIKMFNQFDLYSKSNGLGDIEELKNHFKALCEKYVPGEISW